eukprot:6185114-Pleurochrysis_carterae.AAC.1
MGFDNLFSRLDPAFYCAETQRELASEWRRRAQTRTSDAQSRMRLDKISYPVNASEPRSLLS